MPRGLDSDSLNRLVTVDSLVAAVVRDCVACVDWFAHATLPQSWNGNWGFRIVRE